MYDSVQMLTCLAASNIRRRNNLELLWWCIFVKQKLNEEISTDLTIRRVLN